MHHLAKSSVSIRKTLRAISRPAKQSQLGRVEDERGGCAPRRPLRFLSPLISRVEHWRAGVGRSLCSPLSRPFVCECHTISTMPRFQPPPRRTQHADLPHCALLFASPQGLSDLSCRGDFRQRSANPVTIEQSQGFVQPLPTPSRPAEALSFPSAQHVAPNLLSTQSLIKVKHSLECPTAK